jgi:hypothetical protein
MKLTTFWNIAPCSLTENTDVSDIQSASIIAMMMEPECASETSVLHAGDDIKILEKQVR